MACATNFAFANRQMMLHEVRGAFERVFRGSWERLGVELVVTLGRTDTLELEFGVDERDVPRVSPGVPLR